MKSHLSGHFFWHNLWANCQNLEINQNLAWISLVDCLFTYFNEVKKRIFLSISCHYLWAVLQSGSSFGSGRRRSRSPSPVGIGVRSRSMDGRMPKITVDRTPSDESLASSCAQMSMTSPGSSSSPRSPISPPWTNGSRSPSKLYLLAVKWCTVHRGRDHIGRGAIEPFLNFFPLFC